MKTWIYHDGAFTESSLEFFDNRREQWNEAIRRHGYTRDPILQLGDVDGGQFICEVYRRASGSGPTFLVDLELAGTSECVFADSLPDLLHLIRFIVPIIDLIATDAAGDDEGSAA